MYLVLMTDASLIFIPNLSSFFDLGAIHLCTRFVTMMAILDEFMKYSYFLFDIPRVYKRAINASNLATIRF
ncbi:hypothetical protein V1478_002736, partial [Vespula squamosa]